MACAPSLDGGGPYIVSSPLIPFVETIPGGLFPGRSIVIKGTVLHDPNQKRFAVELCCGLLVQGDHQDNKALHFNPRFDTNRSWFVGHADREIVLNSMIGNRWGMEERYKNVFKEGVPFSIRILVLSDYYKIAVDGRHLCDYLHRISLSEVRTIYIRGNVRISAIEFQGSDGTSSFERDRTGVDIRNSPHVENIQKPKVPFKMSVKEKLTPGLRLLITGTPLMNAERFSINLLTPQEYFFHFRVDLPTEKEKGAVVRNSTQNGVWQKEEREMCFFPFQRGITFDIVFQFEKKHIITTLNGSHFGNFNYRESSKLEDVESINVKGELSLQKICLK